MGWGILEDKREPMPFGTVVLDDIYAATHFSADDPEYEHLKKDGNIVLQPQPSDSPNDPLNWSNRHKYLMVSLLIISMTTVGATHHMLGTGMRILAEHYHTTFPVVVASLTPPTVISHAVGLFFASAIAAVWGKRIGYVIGITIIWFQMLAGYFANSLHYYKALNIVGGLAGAPLELLMGPMITDMVYIHQRGKLMALSAVIGTLGGDASHVIAGNVITKLGIKYTFIISMGVISPLVVLIYLFVWETTYIRAPRKISASAIDISADDFAMLPSGVDGAKPSKNTVEVIEKETITPSLSQHSIDQQEAKYTWKQQLVVFRGRVSDRKFFTAFLQPFPLMVFPSVIFATVVNGAFITWLVISMIISFQVFAYPPYNLKPDMLAYIGLPGSLVTLCSAVCSGILSDWLIKFMSHRNKGVYEPEFRLILMIPAAIFTTMGFSLTGPGYAAHWPVVKLVSVAVLFHIGGPFASSACITYIFDIHGRSTTEAFVATSLFKSIFIFFASQYVPSWFAKVGPIKVYRYLSILNLVFCTFTIPMYMFGKRLRAAVGRSKRLMRASNE